jgi:hypothetical protein
MKIHAQAVPFSHVLPQDFSMNTAILRDVAKRIAGNVPTSLYTASLALSAKLESAVDEGNL